MSENLAVILPAEVEQLAQNVSIEKRNEVIAVLNHVFNGVSKMRNQLDSVVVVDENDKVNMKLANTIRLGVREVRLDAEKEFDKKRSEVQSAMLSFKTEDALWLKSKQTMQILTKEIEEIAKWKEATKERIEAERKELKVQERIIKIAKFNPELSRSEFENMSDSMFDLFFAGIEKQYNDKIAAEEKERLEKIETDRINKLNFDRENELAPYADFSANIVTLNTFELGKLPDADFAEIKSKLSKAKEDYNKKQVEIRLENERLQKEADRKAKELEIERKQQAILLEKERAIAVEKQKAIEETARIEREKQAEVIRGQQAKQREIEAQLQAQKDAELKRVQVEKQRLLDIESEKAKSAKAPDKVKLTKWIESMNIEAPEIVNLSALMVAKDIDEKFGLFKKWSYQQIEKL